MFQNQQQQQQGGMFDFRTTMNMGVMVVRALAVTMEVFLHQGFGARYFGLQAVVAVPVIFIFGIFWQGHDLEPLMLFLALYVFACVYARIATGIRQYRGDCVHSRYSGYPSFLGRKAAHAEGNMKLLIEPCFVALCGFAMTEFNRPLGTYRVLAAIGLYLSNSMDKAWRAAQSMDLQDAVFEQRQKASRFDQLRGRR
jgi:hypothetical protein